LGSLLANASRSFGGGSDKPLTLPNLRTVCPLASCAGQYMDEKFRKCKGFVRRSKSTG
jgi:hypothetical protein